MLDDLRAQAGNEEFFDGGEEDNPDLFDDLESFEEEEEEISVSSSTKKKKTKKGSSLKIGPAQRFIVSFFLLLITVASGALCLVVTGTVVP